MSTRSISYHQYGLLRTFGNQEVSNLGSYHQGTIGSFLKRGWLIREKRSQGTFLRLSEEGNSMLYLYENATAPERKHPGPMTEYASSLLHLARLVKGKKAA